MMDLWFRRRRFRLLKPLLSLTLVCACVLMIHRLKLDKDSLDLRRGASTPCGSSCFRYRPSSGKEIPVRGSNSSSVQDPPRNRSDTWDVHAHDCRENSALKKKFTFRRLDQRFQQFMLRRHCKYFPMILDHPEKCGAGGAHLLVVVKSVIEQHDRREAVRRTWGQERTLDGKNIRTLFLLGTPAPGKDARNLQKLIEYEDRIYGDILQWDFMDTFFNLTLKEVNFLKWFDIYCPEVRFIFKGDDDVFVNTNNLLDLIGFKVEARAHADLFVGDTIRKASPIRNRQSKYYIPREIYDKPYPPYVGGGGFLMSADLARRLFVASEDLDLYPIDDVFLGMCLQKLGLVPEMHPGFRTFGIMRQKVSLMNKEPCFYRDLIMVHKLNPQELLQMWSRVHDEGLVCARRLVASPDDVH